MLESQRHITSYNTFPNGLNNFLDSRSLTYRYLQHSILNHRPIIEPPRAYFNWDTSSSQQTFSFSTLVYYFKNITPLSGDLLLRSVFSLPLPYFYQLFIIIQLNF